MKKNSLQMEKLQTIFGVGFVLQCLFSLALLILLAVLERDSVRAATKLIAGIVFLIAAGAVVYFFLFMLRPMNAIDEKLRKIRDEMPGDPFWQKIKGSDTTGQVMRNIDELFDRVKDQASRDYQEELMNRQAEFSALQSQINPHFLYNTLDSIRGQALLDGADEIAEMTEALSTFFRYSISQKGAMVTLNEELKNVENYFFIQQFRFSSRFEYSIVTEDPTALGCYIPKLTIQPIVENSIFHGLENKLDKGHISIRIAMTTKRLIIDIFDDGIGMDQATLEALRHRLEHGVRQEKETGSPRRTGIAISNVNQRIRLFFGPEYGVTVSSTPGMGTNVQVVIPVVTDPSMKAGNHA